jgi:type 1 glutamine amidotransferase
MRATNGSSDQDRLERRDILGSKKAIVIGNYTNVAWHPLKGPDKELADILRDFEVEFTEDYDRFKNEIICQYDLCVSYTEDRLTDEQVAGLLTYVLNGGGLLAIHNGIVVEARHEAAHLAGGRFRYHPDQKVLTYEPTETDHIIMEGIESFDIMEEPYQFDLDNLLETTLLLEYESEGKKWPAAWAHSYGLGRVVYLSPGHQADSFKNPMYRNLIRRSALWAAGLL